MSTNHSIQRKHRAQSLPHPAKAALGRRNCARTSATPPTSSRPSAPASSTRCPTGSSCARPASRSASTPCSISTLPRAVRAQLHRAGGIVHWARDAEARQIVVDLMKASGSNEVIKIKSMTTEEISAQHRAGSRREFTPTRPTSPSSSSSLARPALAHRRPRAAQESPADPRDLFRAR
jgi:hypothetical protein